MAMTNTDFTKTLPMPPEFQAQAAAFADAKGLSLAAREVIATWKDSYINKRGKRVDPILTLIVSAESLMALGLRERTFAPISTEFTADGSQWVDVWLAATPPAACRVTFEVDGIDAPVRVVHTWAEYTQGRATFAQEKMSATMLAKATRCLGIRQIAPSATGGLLSEEEAAAVANASDTDREDASDMRDALTPAQDKEAKGSRVPRSVQYKERRDELVRIGKALRAECGDAAADTLGAAIRDGGHNVDRLSAADMRALTAVAGEARARATAPSGDDVAPVETASGGTYDEAAAAWAAIAEPSPSEFVI